MEEILKNSINKENLKYLQYICENDFYKNDREFIKIIKKLTEQSGNISNKALNLVSILNEVEKIKFDMIQKEIFLGLKQDEKPYGIKIKNNLKNNIMYFPQISERKEIIDDFLILIDNFFEKIDINEKKNSLIQAKEYVDILKKFGEKPESLIITPQRAKVWFILENNFKNTIKKFDMDLFIDKIKVTRLKYQNEINSIYDFYQEKEQATQDIKKALKTKSTNEISAQYKILDKRLSVNIEPLLIDTSEIMNSLNFMIEEIPNELSITQQNELKGFLPAISEFYIDQCHGISGGISYTSVSKKLIDIQNEINKNNNIQNLLLMIDKLDYSIQHLYLLHWIAESLLKQIMDCKGYSCTIGRLVGQYIHNFSSHYELDRIRNAIYVRNDIAHNALIWEPEKIELAIRIYREFIKSIEKDREIDLSKFIIPRTNQILSKEQIDDRNEEYTTKNFESTIEEINKIDNIFCKQLIKELKDNNWMLTKERKKYYENKILLPKLKEIFSNKNFNDSYSNIVNKLDIIDSDNETKYVGAFHFIFKNQNHEDYKWNLDRIKGVLKDYDNHK